MHPPYFQPLQAGEILIGALRVYRDHLRLLVMVSLLPHLALLALETLVLPRSGGATQEGVMILLAVTVLTNAITLAALTLAIGRALLGEEPGVGEVYAQTFRRGVLAPMVAYLVTALLISGGMMALIVPGVLLGALFAPCIPAIVVERLSPLQGIRRSVELIRGQLLKGVSVFIFFMAASGLLPLLLLVVQINIAMGPFSPLLGALIGSVTLPLGYAASVLLYFSLRAVDADAVAGLTADLAPEAAE